VQHESAVKGISDRSHQRRINIACKRCVTDKQKCRGGPDCWRCMKKANRCEQNTTAQKRKSSDETKLRTEQKKKKI
jgi:hypothetical protein